MTPVSNQPAGIVLIDKPIGWSSHRVVNFVRKATGVKRVGHTGTLDPFASGLLIVLVGRNYTKLQDTFLKQDKSYRCQLVLGYATTTLDCTGEIIATADRSILQNYTETMILQVLEKLTGTYDQRPPAFAAIKQSGEKLYHHARELLKQDNGLESLQKWQTTLPLRKITINAISVLAFQPASTNSPFPTLEIEVTCSSGTYIRSLVRDIGEQLGIHATTTSLQRISIGQYQLSSANSIDTPMSQWRWLDYSSSELTENTQAAKSDQ